MLEGRITYFEKMGRVNSDEVLRIAKKRAEELGIKTILVATTGGDVGAQAAEFFKGYKVVVVTHATGYKAPDAQELDAENQARIENNGGIIFTTTHFLGGLDRAIRRKFQTCLTADIVASTLRVLGDGMKVVCEIAPMAADAGLVSTEEDVIAIAGTGRGADTAVVLRPAHGQDFFDLRVKEILCKPRF